MARIRICRPAKTRESGNMVGSYCIDRSWDLGYFGGSSMRRHRGRYLDTGFSMLD